MAASNGYSDTFNVLIERGANVNLQNYVSRKLTFNLTQ